jgi:hypothetical protein
MAEQQLPHMEYQDAIKLIKEQCRVRPIVPFLGAGISSASGFPTIGAIVEYLSKVDFTIQNKVYGHRYPQLSEKKVTKEYREHPSRFLRDFGWPKLGQLDADLWDWLDREFNPNPEEQHGQRHAASYILPHFSTSESPDLLSRDICPSFYSGNAEESPKVITLDLRDHLRAIAQWGLRRDLRLREIGISNAVLREWLQWKKWYASSRDAPATQPELLYGDWESLLDRLCEGDFDLVDSLFASFEEGRSPTTAHRFLTFLRSSVDIPLILSTNFDSLLERAFHDGGMVPKVFDVHRDAGLPDADLVRRGFSLLKLHGSSYGLRLGERLRSPFERDAQADVVRYLPDNALVVVLGFSGSERRIMQLLQTIATPRDIFRILWLKGPGTISIPLRQLLHECGQAVQLCEINDAGAFLQDWYFAYAQGYQSSSVSYPVLGGQPVRSNTNEMIVSVALHRTELRSEFRKPVQLFVRDTTDKHNPSVSSCATLAAADFVAHLGYRYHPIWIDLESHHTVSGVVTELFDHFRTFDPDAPRIAIVDSAEGDVSNEILQKTVDRIGEMLGRGRYVIVFDSIESFGRTQMMHHGIPTYELLEHVDEERRNTLVTEFETRVHALRNFLEKLLFLNSGSTPSESTGKPDALLSDNAMRYFRDSYIVLAADKEQPRQAGREAGNFSTVNTMKGIREFLTLRSSWPKHVYGTLVKAELPPDALDDAWNVRLDDAWNIRTVTKVLKGRMVSILLLKEGITKGVDQSLEDASLVNSPEHAALVAVLSVFRRPLSIPVVRSLTERWLWPKKGDVTAPNPDTNPAEPIQVAHEYVDHALLTLQKKRHVVIHQGGRIRLEKSIHELFYGGLTSELHVGSVILGWEKRYASDASRRAYAIVQGALVASLHFAAARTMYVDVFLLTRDVQAFYEYLYHRVAVLRILMIMIAMLRLPLPQTMGTAPATIYGKVRTVLKQIYTRFKSSSHDDSKIAKDQDVLHQFLRTVGLTDVLDLDGEQSDEFDLACYIQRLRLHALQTLSLAIGRSERLLRSDASPDTLIGWARQFNQREQSDISGAVFKAAHIAMQEKFGIGGGVDGALEDLMLSPEALKVMKTTSESFNRIAAESYFAKMDFLSVLETELGRENPKVQGLERGIPFIDRAKHLKKLVTSILADMSVDTSQAPIKKAQQWLFPTRALSHLGWHDLVLRACKWAKSVLKEVSASDRAQARRILRDFTELEVKAELGREYPPWHDLDGPCSLKESEKLDKIEKLAEIEKLAVRYETMLRETSRDPLEDARHRSSAYVLRARVLYLQGRFQTAHRYLDLAASGSSEINVEHAVGHAAIHLARAELLIYSSDLHLRQHDQTTRSRSSKEKSEKDLFSQGKDKLAKEGNKIRRAESEVQRAAALLDHAQHQTIWSLRAHMGIAKVTFARLLLEIEKLVRSEHTLDENAFARLSGQLEQSVLNGMQHLRSALDLLPFVTDKWDKIHTSVIAQCSSVEDERKVCAMWIRLYVASRFYWGVLQHLHINAKGSKKHEDIYETDWGSRVATIEGVIAQVNGNAERGERTWQMWCKSLRFNSFADINLNNRFKNVVDVYGHPKEKDEAYSVVAPLRLIILRICHIMLTDNNLKAMWDRRREGLTPKGTFKKACGNTSDGTL